MIASNSTQNLIQYVANLAPAAWWRYGVGITQAGGKASAWADQTSNGITLTQGTGANQPAVNADSSLTFDGAASYITNGALTIAQPFTIYMAVKQDSWVGNGRLVAANARIQQTTATPGIAINAGATTTVDNTLTIGSQGVLAAVFNSTSSVYQSSIGGTSATVTGDAGTGGISTFTIGATSAPAAFAAITVKEVIVYGAAHNATTRLNVLRYLASVAGIGL